MPKTQNLRIGVNVITGYVLQIIHVRIIILVHINNKLNSECKVLLVATAVDVDFINLLSPDTDDNVNNTGTNKLNIRHKHFNCKNITGLHRDR